MTKPKAKAKPKTKREPPPLVLTTAECGYSYTVSVNPDERTPYKHPCTCSILYSSSAVCHECSCSLCADSRALRTPKLSDLELLKRKLADVGCDCDFDAPHEGVPCEELDHDPCLGCLAERIVFPSPGVTASGSRVTPPDASPRNGAASEALPATAPGDFEEGRRWIAKVDRALKALAVTAMHAQIESSSADSHRARLVVEELAEAPDVALFSEREAVLLEVATACGNSGDMYIERAEHWIRETFGLVAAGT
jgi:hypothetical protein